MIDTDKYKGHLMDKAVEDNSQVWVWKNWMLKNAETIEQHKATAALLHDAPKLLAEVKRLRKVLELIAKEMPHDPWMHTLIKDVIGFEKWQAKEMKKNDIE